VLLLAQGLPSRSLDPASPPHTVRYPSLIPSLDHPPHPPLVAAFFFSITAVLSRSAYLSALQLATFFGLVFRRLRFGTVAPESYSITNSRSFFHHHLRLSISPSAHAIVVNSLTLLRAPSRARQPSTAYIVVVCQLSSLQPEGQIRSLPTPNHHPTSACLRPLRPLSSQQTLQFRFHLTVLEALNPAISFVCCV